MCAMSINAMLNRIELSFGEKPAAEVRDEMKAAGFRWHSQKKLWYAKNTAERLALAQKLSGDQAAAGTPEVAAAPASGPVSKFGIKPGDVLEDSWGYEQTNVEFYLVTRILSACKIEIVEIGHTEVESNSAMSGYVMPNKENRIGEPIQKMVSQDTWEKRESRWHVKINDSISLTAWDGQPRFYSSWY